MHDAARLMLKVVASCLQKSQQITTEGKEGDGPGTVHQWGSKGDKLGL